jgi:tetratricopeptide (TPR) repeat protein
MLGQIAIEQNDYPAAHTLLEQSLTLFQTLRDKQGIAAAFDLLGWVTRLQGDLRVARSLAEQGLALAQEIGDTHAIAQALDGLGYMSLSTPEQAIQFFAQSLALYQVLGDKQGISGMLNGLGCTALMMRSFEEAEARFAEALELRRAIGDRRGCQAILCNLGNVALLQDDSVRGRMHYQEALVVAQALDYSDGICGGFQGLATAAALAGEPERATQLLGAAETLAERMGAMVPPDQQIMVDRGVERARAQLSEQAFFTAWNAGRAMPLEQAIAYALEESNGDSVVSIRATSSKQ